LIGTSTIDLYKPTRLAMQKWGVRHVDIDVVEWGSDDDSLKVLAPRRRNARVQKMIAAIEQKKRTISTITSF
jgi:7,8-dihydro-6-hydroxymethylpterin-pyrophosphokinase